ncbi:ATPase, partial [bacterium]|nr:ATPase [bacterium]
MEGYQNSQKDYEWGKMILGIEFGSTRIKAVLIDQNHEPIVSGSHEWENQYVNDFWTYSIESIWAGLQDCYAKLADAFNQKFQHPLTTVAAIGFSGMMHGYMPFGKDGDLLVPFRTWRNTTTGQAAEQLTELFQFNIPQRWSIAHLYQAILNREMHVSRIS